MITLILRAGLQKDVATLLELAPTLDQEAGGGGKF